jgi:hypothetical protein
MSLIKIIIITVALIGWTLAAAHPSARVFRPRDAREGPPDSRAVTLRSNTIEFDVIASDAASRSKELQELTAIYASFSSEQQMSLLQALRRHAAKFGVIVAERPH